MGWVSDNVRKTRVTRAISAFFRAHLLIAKKRPDAGENGKTGASFSQKE